MICWLEKTISRQIIALFTVFYLSLGGGLAQAETFKFGVEVLLEQQVSLLKGKRVGLLTNPSGVNQHMIPTVELFFKHPDINLTVLFGPEHGIRGDVDAGAPIEDAFDVLTGLPVYSLYGATRKPTPQMLVQVDILVFDIQDVGVRPYTYISTMAYAMQAAREAGIPFVVLDRPNPLGGHTVDGAIMQPELQSFIGLYPIPYVHGMTVGELALLFNQEFAIDVELHVIPMQGWQQRQPYDEIKPLREFWIATSPHIPNAQTIAHYATTGLIGELGTLSTGVGYTKPFMLIGAPNIDAFALADALNQLQLPGISFRPAFWRPYYGLYRQQAVAGVQLHIRDAQSYQPFTTALHIMHTVRSLYPDLEFFLEDKQSGFNRAAGNALIFQQLKQGTAVDEILVALRADLEAFKRQRVKYLLYGASSAL